MALNDEPTVTDLVELAGRQGITLTEEQAAHLLTGVKRDRGMVAAIRQLVAPEVEPSLRFEARPAARAE